MGAKWQRFSVEVPKGLNPEMREAFADDVIKHIYERSKKNKSATGGSFPMYTKKYAEQKGSSRTNVNLVLSDTMLKAMKLISHKSGKLLIGYSNGSTQNAKADGNQRGTYGQSAPIPGKARKFMGITKKDLRVIEKKYQVDPKKEIQRISEEVVAGVR